jgi:hypothetical protein
LIFLLDNIKNKLIMILISRVCDNHSFTIPKPEVFEVTENESLRLFRVHPLIHGEGQDSKPSFNGRRLFAKPDAKTNICYFSQIKIPFKTYPMPVPRSIEMTLVRSNV